MLRTLCQLAASLAAIFLLSAPLQAQDGAGDRFAFTQDYDPQPAVWLLEDEDTTIWLLGTIHLLPEGFKWRNPELDAIIEQADELILESVDGETERDMTARAGKLEKLFSAPVRVSEQLPADVQDKWRAVAMQLGPSFTEVDRAPLLLGMLGFMMGGSPDDPSTYEYGVETVLEAEFRANDRPIRSIENFSDILLSLYRRSDRQAVRDLAGELKRWNGKGLLFPGMQIDENADFWEMEHMWAQGELDDEFDLGFGEGKLGARFRKVILEDRNRAWASWLEARLDSPGEVLVAVGAGHFEGHDSVLVMLEERGLQAERIH